MLIKIEELEIGDEIIISGNSKLKYLKVLKKPVLGNRDLYESVYKNNNFTWEVTGKKYKAVRCSIYEKQIPYKSRRGLDAIHKSYKFEEDVTKHNVKISIDLNGRDIYLIKRENL